MIKKETLNLPFHIEIPGDVFELVEERFRFNNSEELVALLLDTSGGLKKLVPIGKGTLESVITDPREIFRPAIRFNAASLILVHNHVSPNVAPSKSDIQLTEKICSIGSMLKIPLLDHIIVGEKIEKETKNYCSLKELGYIPDQM